MRATMNLPDALLSEVMSLSDCSTRTDAVILALKEYRRRLLRERLMSLRGKGIIADDYDVLAERERDR